MQIIKLLTKHSLLFFLIVGVAVAAFMTYRSGLINQYRLVNHGEVTTGFVVQPQCDQHLRFTYQFAVGEITYRGLSVSDQCHQIKSGDPISVHYLDDDPKISTGGDPKNNLVNNVVTILVASLIAPLVLLLIFRIKLREWQRKSM